MKTKTIRRTPYKLGRLGGFFEMCHVDADSGEQITIGVGQLISEKAIGLAYVNGACLTTAGDSVDYVGLGFDSRDEMRAYYGERFAEIGDATIMAYISEWKLVWRAPCPGEKK